MLSAASMRALGAIAARADDVLRASPSGYDGAFEDANVRPPTLEPSTDPLAVVAPPGSYLVTRGARGEPCYTRDGELSLADGQLTVHGDAVLGFRDGAPQLQPLRVDPVDAALGHASATRVDADGRVWYSRTTVDPYTGAPATEQVTLGTLALARFPAGVRPRRLDGVRALAPAGIRPALGRATDGAFGPFTLGARDRGSFDLATGIERLQEAYVAFDALAGAVQGASTNEKTALDLVK